MILDEFYKGKQLSYPQDERIKNKVSCVKYEKEVSGLFQSIILDDRLKEIEMVVQHDILVYNSADEREFCKTDMVLPLLVSECEHKGFRRSCGYNASTFFNVTDLPRIVYFLQYMRNVCIYRLEDVSLYDKKMLKHDPCSLKMEVSSSMSWVAGSVNFFFMSYEGELTKCIEVNNERKRVFMKNTVLLVEISEEICNYF